ncbi:MAG: c-type cytochrome domain-containing protein [Bacteroidota bacterium]
MFIILLIALFVCSSSETFAQTVSYSKDIFPIVKARCLKCHEKDDENPANFAMDNLELMLKSGKSKNVIIPGNAAESYLIKKLLPNPPKGAQMPIFSKKKLSEEEINLFRRWIDQGAKDN